MSGYVLGDFSRAEQSELVPGLERAREAVEMILEKASPGDERVQPRAQASDQGPRAHRLPARPLGNQQISAQSRCKPPQLSRRRDSSALHDADGVTETRVPRSQHRLGLY